MITASFPSPPANTFDVGPVTIHFYGVLMALAVLGASSVIIRRYGRFGFPVAGLERLLVWSVVAGFAGARLAYVTTHTHRFTGRWYAVLFLWEGGIAVFGGFTAGIITAMVLARRWGFDTWGLLDAAAVGLPVGQAIGRWGNYFNQELFGTPTSLPWAVEIDLANRPADYVDAAAFHPTFLYESLFNAAVLIPVILWLERRGPLGRGAAFGVYLLLYGSIRFVMELLRTDTTFRLLGISRNGWVSIGAVLLGAVIVRTRRSRGVAGSRVG